MKPSSTFPFWIVYGHLVPFVADDALSVLMLASSHVRAVCATDWARRLRILLRHPLEHVLHYVLWRAASHARRYMRVKRAMARSHRRHHYLRFLHPEHGQTGSHTGTTLVETVHPDGSTRFHVGILSALSRVDLRIRLRAWIPDGPVTGIAIYLRATTGRLAFVYRGDVARRASYGQAWFGFDHVSGEGHGQMRVSPGRRSNQFSQAFMLTEMAATSREYARLRLIFYPTLDVARGIIVLKHHLPPAMRVADVWRNLFVVRSPTA